MTALTALFVAGFITVWVAMGTLAILVVLGAGAIARRRGGGDIEALIEATRETIPDHVPDAWTKELS